MNPLKFNLDIMEDSYETCDLMQDYDYNMSFIMTYNYTNLDLTGVIIQVQMQKADSKFIIQTEKITVVGNVINVEIDKDLTRVSGKAKLQIVLVKNNKTFGSWIIKCKIKESAINDNDGQSENKVTITEALTNKITEANVAKVELDKSIANGDTSKMRVDIDKNSVDIKNNSAQLADIVLLNYQYRLKHEYGVKGDGVTDDLLALQKANDEMGFIVLEKGKTYCVSDTLVLGNRAKTLIGGSSSVRDYGSQSTIKYIGVKDNKKTVVQLGANKVGEEPLIDCSANVLKDVQIDGNNLAGFGVYGTYLVNETEVDNVVSVNCLEYNMYFAKAWYAKLTNLFALRGRGQGIAFGMPLRYIDGTIINWTSQAPLEMNQIKIDNIRSHGCGRYWSIERPNLFKADNKEHLITGYGLGFGIGNAFTVENFLSESSGGVGVYCYTMSQPIKTMDKGYIEANCLNSGLDQGTTMVNIVFENTSDTGSPIKFTNIFCNYKSGGILHIGKKRNVILDNVHEPRFLKSLTILEQFELYSIFIKNNVYYGCGFFNTNERILNGASVYKEVNTRFSATVDVIPSENYQLIYVKAIDDVTPYGGFVVNYEDGTSLNCVFGTKLSKDKFTLLYGLRNIKNITKSGGTGDTDKKVIFKIVNAPQTS